MLMSPRPPSHHAASCLRAGSQSAQMTSPQVHSPNHMVSSSGPLTEMKLAWHSLAIALASSVFPQPAGVSSYSVQACGIRAWQSFPPPQGKGNCKRNSSTAFLHATGSHHLSL